jgi:diadenosine tetraphosphate (Ap4A) HIT family hydrolase
VDPATKSRDDDVLASLKGVPMSYDTNNIFAKILRGEIPCAKLYEDDHVLAFSDIRPQAKMHALVIPKGAYVSAQDFGEKASEAEIVAFTRALAKVAKEIGVSAGGYRLIANTGAHGHQEVPHYHVHILGGQPMGKMVHLP